jgi:hypothetical protein
MVNGRCVFTVTKLTYADKPPSGTGTLVWHVSRPRSAVGPRHSSTLWLGCGLMNCSKDTAAPLAADAESDTLQPKPHPAAAAATNATKENEEAGKPCG